MPPPDRKKTPTGIDGLAWVDTDDGSQTLWSERLNETYHSGCGAIAESLYVYLINSGVAERLRQGQSTSVFEVGFGTGTNFWLTAALAERSGAQLEYRAVESWLPPPEIFASLRLNVQVADVDAALLEAAQGVLAAWCRGASRDNASQQLEWRNENSLLHLSLGQLEQLPHLCPESSQDAVYFDAFSPQSSPELWTEEIFARMFVCLKPGGCLVTYCVKRSVQDLLRAAGFRVRKQPGPPGGKREVLVAIKP